MSGNSIQKVVQGPDDDISFLVKLFLSDRTSSLSNLGNKSLLKRIAKTSDQHPAGRQKNERKKTNIHRRQIFKALETSRKPRRVPS
jgi:hypothetical protein